MAVSDYYDFADEVQDDILKLMAKDKVFSAVSYRFVKSEYFQGEDRQWIAQFFLDFYERYNTTPTLGQVATYAVEQFSYGKITDVFARNLAVKIKGIFNESVEGAKEYTFDVVQNFARHHSLKRAIAEASPLLDVGDYDKAEELLKEAMTVGLDFDSSAYWYYESTKERALRRGSDEMEDVYPIGIPEIDIHFRRGGLIAGEVAMVAAPKGGGKCVAGNTLVTTVDGLVRMEDIVKGREVGWVDLEETVEVYDAYGVKRRVNKGYCNGKTKTRVVELENGSKIECTPEHKLYVAKKKGWSWVPASKIKEGDCLATNLYPVDSKMKEGQDLLSVEGGEGFPQKVDDEFSYWLGFLLGEGFFSINDIEDDVVRFYTSSHEFKRIFCELTLKLFGIECEVDRDWEGVSETWYYRIFIHSDELKLFLKKNSIEYLSREGRCLPSAILKAPSSCHKMFLKSYMECGALFPWEPDLGIEIISLSDQMIYDVSSLLSLCGVFSKIRDSKKGDRERKKSKRMYKTLSIRGKDCLELFDCVIGFHEGSDNYKRLRQSLRWVGDSILDPYSYVGASSIVKKIMDKVRSKRLYGGKVIDPSVMSFAERGGDSFSVKYYSTLVRKHSNMSFFSAMKSFEYFLDFPDDLEDLKEIIMFGSLKVKSVSDSESYTYDISVPDTHCYLANNIVSHNSIMLSHVARRALAEKHNVAYYTFEMSEEQNADRIDSAFSGVSMWDLVEQQNVVIEKIMERAKSHPRGLMIKQYPTKGRTMSDIVRHLDTLQHLHGWTPDMVVLDYAAIVKPDIQRKQRHLEIQENVEGFRGLLVERHCPGWTAAQINREGARRDSADGTYIAGSYDQLATADDAFILLQTKEERLSGLLRIGIEKIRDGRCGFEVGPFETNWDKMEIVRPTNKTITQALQEWENMQESVY